MTLLDRDILLLELRWYNCHEFRHLAPQLAGELTGLLRVGF
ncbi:hypothetical protein [Methylorubrum thiocyanatum]